MGGIKHVQIEMHGQMGDAFGLDPIQYGLAVLGNVGRRRVADAQLLKYASFILRPGAHACDHDARGIELALDLGGELCIAVLQQHAQHVGMGVRELGGAHDAGVSVDPQHAELSLVAPIQVGHSPRPIGRWAQ